MENGQAGYGPAADIPLSADDDDGMEVDTDSDAGDDMQQGLKRFRQEREAARTLFHYRRADDDTM